MKVFRCCRLRMSPWWSDCCLPNSKHAIPDDEYACGNLTILEHCVWSRGMATHAFHQIIKISRNMTDNYCLSLNMFCDMNEEKRLQHRQRLMDNRVYLW